MGKSGQRFAKVDKKDETNTIYFPKILVPQDVFAFVRAMNEVLDAVDGNRNKIEAQAKTNNPKQPGEVLHTAMAKGTNYDFQLDLCMRRFLFVNMRTVPNERGPGHRPKQMGVPIRVFHGLRQAIGEVFVENGEQAVQQQFGVPPSLPGWLEHVDVIPHARDH